ncbi:MAG TPA: amidohydrolase [Opitutaceae bacterium]|nr:amidohydrolase [Opitutaceae bacterium]
MTFSLHLRRTFGFSAPPFLVLATLACVSAAPQPADLLISNAYVVTMDDRRTVHPQGVVAIRGSQILAVGGAEITAEYTASKHIDARGGIVMPGMINTHTHVSMTVFRGLGDDVPDRLRRFIFPLEKTFVDRDVVYWGGLHGMAEMIAGGVTTFANMYYFEDEIARATRQAGMRAILGQTIINFPAPDAPEPYGGLDLAKKFILAHRGDPLITAAFSPHSPYTVDEEHLRAVANAAEELEAPVLIHLAEMMSEEINYLRQKYQQTPVEYLKSVGLLNRRLIAAHCIFVNDTDIALLKENDVGIAHAMVANLKSAKGVAPALKMYNQGLRIGLATDGPMSGNTLDIIGQLGYVAKIHKLDNKDRNVMPALHVVDMATRGGARALHLEDKVGSLEPGKLADLIIIDTEGAHMIPLYDVYSSLVYAATPADVRTTIIHGRIVMEDRKILSLDVPEIKKQMRLIGEKIQARIK